MAITAHSPRAEPTPAEAEPLFVETEPPLLGGDEEKKPPLGMELVRKRGIVLTQADILKWGSLLMLVLQNSALFVITRYTRSGVKGRLYLTSVVVLIIELSKMAICLVLLLREGRWRFTSLLSNLYQNLWIDRSTTLLLAVPATCYAIQNNLIFVAISNLSAAAAQVLYQLKSLSTAFFTVVLLHRTFSPVQWLSFVLLTLGVVLVQSEDAKSSNTPTGASPLLGVVAALAAATLSGFAGVFLEKMFTSGASSLWMRNVQLGLFAIPLQCLAVFQMDGRAIHNHGLLQGFRSSTWLIIAIQVAGALCTAVVIKFAGNVLKTFATVLALLCTCAWSMVLFDFTPTPVFCAGVGIVALSVWFYARPNVISEGVVYVAKRLSPNSKLRRVGQSDHPSASIHASELAPVAAPPSTVARRNGTPSRGNTPHASPRGQRSSATASDSLRV